MDWEEFILTHESDDTAALLLARQRYPDIDLDLAVTTLEGRRRLRRKVPEWYALPSLVYPTRLGPEQCSSSATARFKAHLAYSIAQGGCRMQRTCPPVYTGEYDSPEPPAAFSPSTALLPQSPGPGRSPAGDLLTTAPLYGIAEEGEGSPRIADLTGGLGVDAWAFSERFVEVLYNEMDATLAAAVEGNFAKLGVRNAVFRSRELVPGNLAEILGDFRPDVLFLDPARRAEDGRKVFRLAECRPDVLALLPELIAVCPHVLMKVSPMADLTQLARELPPLKAVWIVGAGGECKELLLHLERGHQGPWSLSVVELEAAGEQHANEAPLTAGSPRSFVLDIQQLSQYPFPKNEERISGNPLILNGFPPQGLQLFEPGKALAKAGRFQEVGAAFGLTQLDPSTHLYIGCSIPAALQPFGKTFRIEQALPLNKETCRTLRKSIPQAEITARNLPLTSDQLRKKLGIASGGRHHLFGVRIGREARLLVCAISSADPSS